MLFFLKSQNGEEYQPLDNKPNHNLKQEYENSMGRWLDKYSKLPLTYMWFNKIIRDVFSNFLPCSAPCVISSFNETRLFPLQE